ncbi:hypothetical protein ROZALSC1DRAFT_30294 [Rozella allomycis CSF55]|uniref:Threonine/Serine exporter ThrE domain-containing protein n=1 Tax=Rozella allomycis (strain CSF55) TaxID=988480 RepID=A0A4P9YG28_ROZAC|nr:hypothetical protein ROZALSC1DRAFT_30294 [Rozella allomycis CSF55]
MNVLSSVVEVLSAIIVSFTARTISFASNSSVCYWAVSLAGIVWLLPGLGITLACLEISTHNIISGTVHMFYSFIVALMLGFGMSIGIRLVPWASELPNDLPGQCSGVDKIWGFLLFPILIISVNVSSVAYGCYFFLNMYVSIETSSILAAVVVGVLSYMFRQFTGQISTAPILAGIMVLVPGSLGIRGVSAFFDKEIQNGVNFGFEMIIIAVSISVGLFIATLLVNPSTVKRPDRNITF